MNREDLRPYKRFSEIYDSVMEGVPYERWLGFIEEIWNRHNAHPRTVLDLACGTGNMTLLLAQRGYRAIGLDSSPFMLEKARAKALRRRLDVQFVLADMRDFRLELPVDAVVCVFDSINYLVTPEDLTRAFRCVYESLVPSGLFVFDMNTEHRLATIPKEVTLIEGPDYVLVWRDIPDPANSSWEVKLTGFLKVEGVWERFDEHHVEKAHSCESVKAWLEEVGFESAWVYDTLSFNPVHPATTRAYFVARKPGCPVRLR
ncbi:MAG: methyltransferase domain-containing protein [Firmicutes bacterium]|nr:methyltransferase domain-containing protein [Candidatus Fermentithermobacillaceae bacterium]